MHRQFLAAAALVAAVGTTGCLVKDTTHRLYLSPSGAIDWMVLEEGVRSTENDPSRRIREEQDWVAAITGDTHPVAEGLRRLGAEGTSTTLLRPARPYMALTDARFARVDRVVARLFEELGLRGEATLVVEGEEGTLSVSLDLSSLDDPGPELESPVTALLEDLDRYRFVLTDGRFISATGFEILEDGSAAILREMPSETLDARGVLKISLTWRAVH
jgi:hypothetical protein